MMESGIKYRMPPLHHRIYTDKKNAFLIEPLQFYNSYVTNHYAKNKSAIYVMMKGGVS
jgi:hypothetical protein